MTYEEERDKAADGYYYHLPDGQGGDRTSFKVGADWSHERDKAEIERLREYLKENTFIAYLLGKKNSGKGTYARMLKEIVSPDRIEHFSIGDMVRALDEVVQDEKKQRELR